MNSVGKKLAVGFMLMLLLTLIVGGIALTRMSDINTQVKDITGDWLPGVQSINNLNYLTEHVVALTTRAALDPSTIGEAEKDRASTLQVIVKEFEDYGKTVVLAEDKKQYTELKGKWENYVQLDDKTYEMLKANDTQGAIGNIKKSKPFFDAMQTNLDALVKINNDGANQADAKSTKTFQSSIWILSALITIAVVIGIMATVYFVRIISKPLILVTNGIEKVAKGDLKVEPLRVKGKDEIARLAHSCNDMVKSLREVISGTLNTAHSVASASQQISASTEEIASSSTSQAGDAQTMNELFKELSVAINSVAHSAEQAAELSTNTLEIANDGGKVVRASIEGMNVVNQHMTRLEEDSNKIGEIIEVIDDIAEQTNLLALNAAIEAARAGEQGRGFAVVADEVRKLAERSGEATKQITTIIKGMQENTRQSVKAVGEGVVSSEKTGEAFENIIQVVNESALKVAEIAAASEEQAAQSSEVLTSIESISAATEEAAASSEETAATAQSLAQLAEELNNTVTVFKI